MFLETLFRMQAVAEEDGLLLLTEEARRALLRTRARLVDEVFDGALELARSYPSEEDAHRAPAVRLPER